MGHIDVCTYLSSVCVYPQMGHTDVCTYIYLSSVCVYPQMGQCSGCGAQVQVGTEHCPACDSAVVSPPPPPSAIRGQDTTSPLTQVREGGREGGRGGREEERDREGE